MAVAIAFEEAKVNRKKTNQNGTGESNMTPFFGSRDHPDWPHAKLSQFDPGRSSGAHFHAQDQFQVVIGGKGKVGRHDLTPYSVHFSRAYTPYGPLVSDLKEPMTLFGVRPHLDPGSQRLPKELEKLKAIPDREPWQITRPVTFPAFPPAGTKADVVLKTVPDIVDDRGLAVYTLSMNANVKTQAPDHAHGDGQYLVVVEGSLWHANKEQQAPALVFIRPEEDAYEVRAGAKGLKALVLNFPAAKQK